MQAVPTTSERAVTERPDLTEPDDQDTAGRGPTRNELAGQHHPLDEDAPPEPEEHLTDEATMIERDVGANEPRMGNQANLRPGDVDEARDRKLERGAGARDEATDRLEEERGSPPPVREESDEQR